MAEWVTLRNDYLGAGGTPMDFGERRAQLPEVLPTTIRKDVFRELSDFVGVEGIKEWPRV